MSPLQIKRDGNQVRRITHGEPITPEVANRPLEDIVEWLSTLTRQIDAFTEAACNILYNQPLDEEVSVGSVVYLNETTKTFSRARAHYRIIDDRFVPDPCCFALGIVCRKTSSQSGDICLSGAVDIDLTEGGNQDSVHDYAAVGIRYLSSTYDGRVVKETPAISIPVAFVLKVFSTGKSRILVNICLDKIPTYHAHYRLPMKAVPAGICVANSVNIQVNREIEGWLPADDRSFSGIQVPEGAIFGYNLAKSAIKVHFPLATPSTFKLYWQQYSNSWDPLPVFAEVPERLYTITEDGIWWLSDDYFPWYKDKGWIISNVNGTPTPICPEAPHPFVPKPRSHCRKRWRHIIPILTTARMIRL